MNNNITDSVGKNTLEVVGAADSFNEWMFKTIRPFARGKIFEIGSGVGNISEFFIKNQYEIMLTDLREEYCLNLENKFSLKKNILGIDKLDLVHPEFEKIYEHHLERYDTVFSLNVIEHIKEDALAVSNCKKLLKRGGHLIILVPSYQKLYNKFDEELGHFRRYNKKSLSALFLKNQFEIIHKQYFNCMGIVGWYLSGGILQKDTIPSSQMKFYNRLVPAWKALDWLIQKKIGLSTIVVGRK